MTGLLASVCTLEEVRLALAGGADLIDLKDPAAGALGALPLELLSRAVRLIGGRRLVSATVGDLPLEPEALSPAVSRVARAGVDYVKVGFFSGGNPSACIREGARWARQGCRLIAVLFADQNPDFALLSDLASAGFRGAMLDTADKSRGGLRDCLGERELADFVAGARRLGMLAGLAGSLKQADIAPLLALQPDYLGFRGALCDGRQRTSGIDPAALAAVRNRIPGPSQRARTALREAESGAHSKSSPPHARS